METQRFKVSVKYLNGQIDTKIECAKYYRALEVFLNFKDELNADNEYENIDEPETGDELTAYFEGGRCWIKLEQDND